MRILVLFIRYYIFMFFVLVIVAFPFNALVWLFASTKGSLFPLHILAIVAFPVTLLYVATGWAGVTAFAEMNPDHPEVQDIKSRGGSVYWDSLPEPIRPRNSQLPNDSDPDEWRPIK